RPASPELSMNAPPGSLAPSTSSENKRVVIRAISMVEVMILRVTGYWGVAPRHMRLKPSVSIGLLRHRPQYHAAAILQMRAGLRDGEGRSLVGGDDHEHTTRLVWCGRRSEVERRPVGPQLDTAPGDLLTHQHVPVARKRLRPGTVFRLARRIARRVGGLVLR